MIDEISLVEYSDEETADSEQLESFRKFCEEQNSEGVQESTPSASNTESAVDLRDDKANISCKAGHVNVINCK